MRKYIDYLDEISSEELLEGLLAYGMFSDKLPPIFSSVDFYAFIKNSDIVIAKKKTAKYIYYETIRNIGVPRQLGIPNPFKYAVLCQVLSDNWGDIRNRFELYTRGDRYKISRIHIRKNADDKSLLNTKEYEYDIHKDDDKKRGAIDRDINKKKLFEMNSNNWIDDGDPITLFSLGKKYVVKADISLCFPSIYTHAIPWALVGKETAKENKLRKNEWYNQIDAACQNMRDGETHGLLIGPHTSNLISEIILTKIDEELKNDYTYIRNIDDYTCYVENYSKAEKFLKDLEAELRKFDLNLNHKKSSIEKLPQCTTERWVRVLSDIDVLWNGKTVNYKMAKSYFDTAIQLLDDNGHNLSTVFYAIKVLGGHKMSDNARQYCVKTMCYLAIIYPYLVTIIDKYVFEKFLVEISTIEGFSNTLYEDSIQNFNSEALNYSIFFAIKYKFKLNINVDEIIKSYGCISKLLALEYFKNNNDVDAVNKLLDEAKKLKENDFDENWLFIYEALKSSELEGDWKKMKNEHVSFLRQEYCFE